MASNNKDINNSILFIIYTLGFLYLIMGINYNINVYDEANALVGAMRINNGELPYRDFWSMYAPGQYYLTALIRLITSELIYIRIISALMMLGIAISTYKISKLLWNNTYSIINYIIIIILGSEYSLSGRGILSTILLTVVGLYYLMKHLEYNANNKSAYIHPIIWGAAIWFRHDFALYLCGSQLIYLFYVLYRREKYLIPLMQFVIIIAVGSLPYFVLSQAISVNYIYEQLVRVPAEVFADYRNLKYSFPFADWSDLSELGIIRYIVAQWKSVIVLIPIAILTLSGIVVSRNKPEKSKELLSYMILTGLCFMMLNQARVRTDIEHVFPSLILCIMLLPIIVSQLKDKLYRLLALSVFVIFISVLAFHSKVESVIQSYNQNGSEYLESKGVRYITIDKQWHQEYTKTIDWIKFNTLPEDKIFICNEFNDRITINDMMLYHISDRLPATKYHELHPGIATQPEIQTEIISDLIKNMNKYIVKVSNNYTPEANKSSQPGSKIMDQYIMQNYEWKEQFGNYKIYVKK